MATATIEFTEEEVNALLVLIDAAVRSGGLQHAGNGVFLANKIRSHPFAQHASNDEQATIPGIPLDTAAAA